MYLCQVCNECSERGQPRYKHTIYRQRVYLNGARGREIEREIGCCPSCYDALRDGESLPSLLKRKGNLVSADVMRMTAQPVKLGGKVFKKGHMENAR